MVGSWQAKGAAMRPSASKSNAKTSQFGHEELLAAIDHVRPASTQNGNSVEMQGSGQLEVAFTATKQTLHSIDSPDSLTEPEQAGSAAMFPPWSSHLILKLQRREGKPGTANAFWVLPLLRHLASGTCLSPNKGLTSNSQIGKAAGCCRWKKNGGFKQLKEINLISASKNQTSAGPWCCCMDGRKTESEIMLESEASCPSQINGNLRCPLWRHLLHGQNQTWGLRCRKWSWSSPRKTAGVHARNYN